MERIAGQEGVAQSAASREFWGAVMSTETNRAVELTVDVLALVGKDRQKVVMIKRAKPPYEDRWVLPGGHVEERDVSLTSAAARELWEETGIVTDPSHLTQFTILDALDRDPRGRKISVVFVVNITEESFAVHAAGSDAASVEALYIESISPHMVGFDHYRVFEMLARSS